MPEFAHVDLTVTPPAVTVPRHYNAAVDFVDRHLTQGRGDRLAIIDDGGQYSYAEVAERVNRAGNMLDRKSVV